MLPFLRRASPERLLEEVRLPMQGLLCRLRGEQAAEDLLAETNLVLMQRLRGGRRPRHWKAFALKVAWNTAQAQARSAARRRRPVPAFDAPADPAKLAELREWVQEALAGLSEQEQLLLHLRHVEDLSHREIARVVGCARGTVGGQLEKARCALQRRLERLGGGKVSALSVALLPLLGGSLSAQKVAATVVLATAASTGGALGISLIGGGAMSMKVLSGITALAICGVLAFLTLRDEEEPKPADELQGVLAETTVDVERPPADESPSSGAAEAEKIRVTPFDGRAAGAEAGWVVRGRTRRGDRVYPDARLLVRVYAGYVARGEPLVETRVSADPSGAFACPLESPGRDVTVWVKGDLPKHWCLSVTETVFAGDPAPQDLRPVLYPFDATIAGSVRTTDGRPVRDALVHTSFTKTRTDPEGRFELPVPSDASSFSLWARARGLGQEREIVRDLEAGGRKRVDFHLQPEVRITGRVLLPDGTPVSGARVSGNIGRDLAVTTDAAGRYTLKHVVMKPSGGLGLHATRADLGEGQAVVSVSADVIEQDIVIERGARVSGIVKDAEDDPIAGAWVYIGFSPAAFNRRDAYTDAAGRFSFPAAPPGRERVVVQRRGYAAITTQLDFPKDGAALDDVVFVLERGKRAAGHVVSVSGAGIEGALVVARHKGEYLDAIRDRTDASGRFDLEGLPATEVSVEVYHPEFNRLEAPLDVPDKTDWRFELKPFGVVAGSVVDATTQAPITKFRVRFVRPVGAAEKIHSYVFRRPWFEGGKPFDSADGTWSTRGTNLVAGKAIGLEIRAPGYFVQHVPKVTVSPASGGSPTVIALEPAGSLRGSVVVRDTDAPVTGASVRVSAREDDYDPWSGEFKGRHLATRSDVAGRFELDVVPRGSFWLVVEHADHPKHILGPYQSRPGQPLDELTLKLDAAVELKGRVAPMLSGRRVVLVPRGEGDPDPTVPRWPLRKAFPCRADGSFTAAGLKPGRYDIGVELAVGETTVMEYQRIIELGTGERSPVILGPEGRTILGGSLTCDRKLDRPITVRVIRKSKRTVWQDPTLQRGTLTRNGRFEIRGLQPGTYLVNAWCQPDRNSPTNLNARSEVTIAAGARQTIELTLR